MPPIRCRGQTGPTGPAGPSSGASVAAAESTTSTTYTDLATVGPSITLTTGTSVNLVMSATVNGAVGALTSMMSVEVSGATSVAAGDANACSQNVVVTSVDLCLSRVLPLTGLIPGVNTFTLKYRINGGNAVTFSKRSVAAMP